MLNQHLFKSIFLFSLIIPMAVDVALASDFEVRRDSTDKNVIDKPARFMYSNPKAGSSSWNSDVAASVFLPLIDDPKWETSLDGELHWNTLVDKKQNFLSGGVTVSYQTETDQKFSIAYAYKADRVKTTTAHSLSLGYLPTWSEAGINVWKVIGSSESGIRWSLTPNIHIEYEHDASVPAPLVKGRVFRAAPSIELAIGLFPREKLKSDGSYKYAYNSIQASFGYKYWYDFSQSGRYDTTQKKHKLIETELLYYLDGDKHFSLGTSYVNGENPSKGLQDQEYYTVYLGVLFK